MAVFQIKYKQNFRSIGVATDAFWACRAIFLFTRWRLRDKERLRDEPEDPS